MTMAPAAGQTLKMIYVGKRNPALGLEDFPARWKQHAVLSATVASVADVVNGMAQCSRLADDTVLPGASAAFDGVSIMVVTDPQRIHQSRGEEKHIELLLPDELKVFTDYVYKSTVVATEQLIYARPIERARGKFIVIDIVTKLEAITAEDFQREWRQHGRALAGLPKFKECLLRFALNSVYGERPPGHDYDGVSEMWFESVDDVARFFTTETRATIDRGLAAFCDMRGRVLLPTFVSHAFYRPGVLSASAPV